MKGKLLIIGFGPGSYDHITERAKQAIQESDCIVGYKTYVELIQGLITDQKVISTGMSEEVSRAQAAVKLAEEGKKVAVISSGDAGVYGMSGLVYEVLVEKGWKEETGVEVEVIPGISAINSCASLLGAPVMHDACTISLSDHLTPWKLIEKRIEAAAQADFVIAFYNPKSGRRTRQIVEAQTILLKHRSPDTPVGLVKSAYRDREDVVITSLREMLDHEIGMLTTVIVGNSQTFLYDSNKLITPRGYQRKYTLNTEKQRLKPHERLRKENEPWALQDEEPEKEHQPEKETQKASALELATEALALSSGNQTEPQKEESPVPSGVESILEFGVSPGLVNKKFTAKQLMTLAEVVGEHGEMEYTPHHLIKVQLSTDKPEQVTEQLEAEGFLLLPAGDVLQIKACDFCDGEKYDSIPYVEQLQDELGGMPLPKELKLGFNGCGMACYGGVQEDIGIVFRKGKFDLFLGGKPLSRTAHSAQPVMEGIEPEKLVGIVTSIIQEYEEKGHPNERFFKFFKRVQQVGGFKHRDMAPVIELEPAPCGD
ncbi:precorrin-3B C(17)-methyltransferase [Fictibacillus terranigra]|uniref:Precorrin-3B C(17)-methyltransferase n=1 Tax=Fictibacillus terranigra TaxID=3058424 RepID=A0ABT8E878_9BACL|nr:precorrin-3B C(17)-methyltransferase [Fictibacillus sp. CENA-BCM004]MDN4074132.1 precorrin-3B C(17)-methyltransferase [Fictibacillus sp. CENA-BCM004]